MFLWTEIAKKKGQEVAAAYSTWRRAINAAAVRGFLETRRHRQFYLGAHLYSVIEQRLTIAITNQIAQPPSPM